LETRSEATAVAWLLDCVLEWTVQGLLSMMVAPASSGALVSTSPSMSAMVTPLPV
jgi:hypothetical protein